MSEEEYVKFGTAKILKEKGFDWECSTYLYTINVYNYGDVPCRFQVNDSKNSELASDKMTAPTQQMACRWLREEHKIHITTEPLEMFKQEKIVYEPIIYLLNDFDDFALEYKTVHLKECDTNEDAIEVALEYALTKLI